MKTLNDEIYHQILLIDANNCTYSLNKLLTEHISYYASKNKWNSFFCVLPTKHNRRIHFISVDYFFFSYFLKISILFPNHRIIRLT